MKKPEEFLKLVEKYKDCLVIVEGEKDEKALRRLGFTRVKRLNKALYKVVEEVKEKRVVILTDLDKKGKELYGRLNSALRRQGVLVDNKLREFLFRNSKVRCIEGLKVKRLEG